MGNNIEENIEILEKFKNDEMQRDKLERDVRCGGWKIGDIYKCLELDNAIDNILSDYKRVLKENEEKTTILLVGAEKVKQLEKENKEWQEAYQEEKDKQFELLRSSIPVKEVKDKIEHYQKLQHNYIEKYDEINEGLQAMISALQELLEGRE